MAVVLDLYSRRILGWSTGSNMRTELPLEALNQALVLRKKTKGVLHHSDRGSQYTSEQYLKRQETAEPILMFWHTSFGSAGTCLDNAAVESFFSVLKRECLNRKSWKTRSELDDAIRDFIDRFYNPVRIRSNGKTPIQSEREYNQFLAQRCA